MRPCTFGTFSVILLLNSFLPSTVAGGNGPFSISVSSPKVCVNKTFSYSSEMAMPTGSFVIDLGSYGMGQPGQQWYFTPTDGFVLDPNSWGEDGPLGDNIGKSIVRSWNGSYTFTVPTDGSWAGGVLTGNASVFVNPNPLGCSTIVPSEIDPYKYAKVTGLWCACQGTTLPLQNGTAGCAYRTLPTVSPASLLARAPVYARQMTSPVTRSGATSTNMVTTSQSQPQSQSQSAHAVTSGASGSFTLTVSATLPCTALATQAPEVCDDNNNPGLTPQQWLSHGADDFWQTYFDNKSHWQDKGLMTQFFQDFSGGVNGDGINYQCIVDNEVSCQFLQDCQSVKTGPNLWLEPYKIQAYYIWAGMTGFSKIMNLVWQALDWAGNDMAYYAGLVGQKFQVELPKANKYSSIFPILNTVLTLLAIAFIIADPFVGVGELPAAIAAVALTTAKGVQTLAPYVGSLVGAAAAFGLAADVDVFQSSTEQAEVTLETIYTDEGEAKNWIRLLQNQVTTMHDAIWVNGSYGGNSTNSTNAKQLMTGGFYLNAGQILRAVNLQQFNDTRSDPPAAPTNYMTQWFENMLITDLINWWYRSNNVYIVYIPYGPVKGLNEDNSWETFTQDVCIHDWVNGTTWQNWNTTVVADCLENGMAVLTNAASTMLKPSFYKVANMTYNGVTYSPYDMIRASVNGFLKYGFNYNASELFVAKLLDPTAQNLVNFTQYLDLEPSSPGMYNLDVCQIRDLGAVPNSVAGPWPNGQYPGWPAQTQPCSCLSNNANSTIGGQTLYFRDHASADITNELSGVVNNSIVASVDSSCYVIRRGDNQCYPDPDGCVVITPPR